MDKERKSSTSSSKREDASEEKPTKQEQLGQTPSDESGRGTGSTEESSLVTPQASGSASGTDEKDIPGPHIDPASSDAKKSLPPKISPTETKSSSKQSPIGMVEERVRKGLSPKKSDDCDKDSTTAKSPGRSPIKAKSPKKASQHSPESDLKKQNPILSDLLWKQNGTAEEKALVPQQPKGAEGSDSSSATMTPGDANDLSSSDVDMDSVKPLVGASSAADATVPPVARRFSEEERQVTSQISKSLDLGGVGKSDGGSEEASASGFSATGRAKVKRPQFDSQEEMEVSDPESSPKKQPKRDTDESKSDPKDE